MKKIRSCGCDLGMKNFAVSIIDGNTSGYKIIHTRMLQYTITSLKGNISAEIDRFYVQFTKLLKKYRPAKLIAERFMVRGRFGGAIAECLSFMLGIIACICKKLKIQFEAITSASWKNAFQRAQGKKLDGLYKHLKPLPPHIVDSVLQATYGINPVYSNWNILPLRTLQHGVQSRKNPRKAAA